MVFDLTVRSSFDAVVHWTDDMKKVAPSSLPVLLVGNKSDLEAGRVIAGTEAEGLARSVGACAYMETSCRTGHGVHEVFHHVARLAFDRKFGSTPTEGERAAGRRVGVAPATAPVPDTGRASLSAPVQETESRRRCCGNG
jgi:GTPase SAR1 family protein